MSSSSPALKRPHLVRKARQALQKDHQGYYSKSTDPEALRERDRGSGPEPTAISSICRRGLMSQKAIRKLWQDRHISIDSSIELKSLIGGCISLILCRSSKHVPILETKRKSCTLSELSRLNLGTLIFHYVSEICQATRLYFIVSGWVQTSSTAITLTILWAIKNEAPWLQHSMW